MFKRRALLGMMLLSSVGVPVSLTSANLRDKISGLWSSPAAQGDVSTNPAAAAGQVVKVPGAPAANTPTKPARVTQVSRLTGSIDPAEILRFDITTGWVMSRWERVSAGLADIDLQGYRVPLVTGTSHDDLAGSLTYYFDKQQQVQRITFHGTTGNPHKLVALVTGRYNFLRQVTSDPSLYLYQVKWNGKPQSELRIKTARVVRADTPHNRYQIDLAMRRP